MAENGDLARMIGQLLDEKLAPLDRKLMSIERDMVEVRTITRGLSGAIGRIETRLMVVEAILGIDPDRPKH